MSEVRRQLTAMANKPFAMSKKWRMTIIACHLLMLIFVFSLTAIWFVPPQAESIVSLAKLAFAALALVSAGYCGAQAHADGKTATALAQTPEPKSST